MKHLATTFNYETPKEEEYISGVIKGNVRKQL